MTIRPDLQPDQRPEGWDDHVRLYEAVFEPLLLGFARQAVARLGVRPGMRVLDVAAVRAGPPWRWREAARSSRRSTALRGW